MEFNIPRTILSWVRSWWHIPAQTITLPPPKWSDSYTHWSVKRSPRKRYTRSHPSLKRSESQDSSIKRMCCQVWSLQRRHARAQASLVVLWRFLRIGSTPGRLAWSPDSRSILRSVRPVIRTFTRPDVLRAVSSVVIIRFRRWIRWKCLSWRCDVTCGLPLWGLSFVLPVCRRRIISLEMVILDTFKWYATA